MRRCGFPPPKTRPLTDEGMFGQVLQVVLDALQSKYGVFGYIDEEGALACLSMTMDIWDQCQIPDKDIVFPRENWGDVSGQSLTEKMALHSNEPLRVPEGHIPFAGPWMCLSFTAGTSLENPSSPAVGSH